MAIHSGFFNALSSGGSYDRVYDADDYCDNMGAIISNGVRRSGDNDLKVSAAGMVLKVGIGRAWIQGHWLNNDTEYTVATVIAPTGTNRKDGVFVRLDTNTSVRSMSIVYRTGTASVYPACVRSGGIYELMLAKIDVAAGATNLTVTDTRASKSLCGWVRSPVGYDDYFDSLDSAFEDWFDAMKGQLSEDAAGNLQNQISQQNAVISKYVPVELYAWDGSALQQEDDVLSLSQPITDFDRIEIAYCTAYEDLLHTIHHEPSYLTRILYPPQTMTRNIYFSLEEPAAYGATSQGEMQEYIYLQYCDYYISSSNPSGIHCVEQHATNGQEPSTLTIMKVTGYGNRNAPPIAPYQEVQTDSVTDEVEEVVTP